MVKPDRLIWLPELQNRVGMARATIWRRVKDDPSFPRPIKLSEGVTCWSENEVSEWIEKLKGARDG